MTPGDKRSGDKMAWCPVEAEAVVLEIGSTTTLATAFEGLIGGVRPRFLGQGAALTTVDQGDVTIGVKAALADLAAKLSGAAAGRAGDGHVKGREADDGGAGEFWDQGFDAVRWGELYATSSAAGGLRITVHGLVYDMTAKAAREAALGAGGIVKMVTAGVLSEADLEAVGRERPNMILLAGGVDHGEKETVLRNALSLASFLPKAGLGGVPILYCGNCAARAEVEAILRGAGLIVRSVPNVYPRLDELVVEPAREAIQELFEEHIVSAPGMASLKAMVRGGIMPTPGAVMRAAEVWYKARGDVVVFDIGGATTDVHSVTEGAPELAGLSVTPEPLAKRTVEGDLGVYRNAVNVAELFLARLRRDRRLLALVDDLGEGEGPEELRSVRRLLGEFLEQPARGGEALRETAQRLASLAKPVPATAAERVVSILLAGEAARVALERHAGRRRDLLEGAGRHTLVEGKDLTQTKWLVGTGGALVKLGAGPRILAGLRSSRPGRELVPPETARILIDRRYIMAAAGLFSRVYPEASLAILEDSLEEVPGF